jgi:large subunit ribosomal protein L21
MAENYAIISLSGKQYVVHEGERFLVDRLDREEGKTFHPDVLFLGGVGAGEVAPKSAQVTAKVVGHVLGEKIRIGKYKPKSGYKRHTGHRSRLTQVEITTIGKKTARATTATITKAAEDKPAVAPKKAAPKRAPARKPAAKKTTTTKKKA